MTLTVYYIPSKISKTPLADNVILYKMHILVTFLKLWTTRSKWRPLRLVVLAWNDSLFRRARNRTSYLTLPMIFRHHLLVELWISTRKMDELRWVAIGVPGNSIEPVILRSRLTQIFAQLWTRSMALSSIRLLRLVRRR